VTGPLDLILDDLSEGLRRRSERRRRLRAVQTGAACAAVAMVLGSSAAGLVPERSVTATADAGPVLGLSGCERDAFGCLKLTSPPQD